MEKRFFIIITILVMLSSCLSRGKDNINEMASLSLSMDNVLDKVKLSEIALSVECVSLETNDSALIDKIVRIVRQDNNIYVADKSTVYKYDKKGALIGFVRKLGTGPDEYARISDFQIDSMGDVWILSRNNQSLYKYNWENRLQDKVFSDYWINKFCLLDDETMLLYIGNEVGGGNKCQLQQLNLKTKKSSNGYLAIDSKRSKYLHVHSNNNFSGGGGGRCHYFFQQFNDTVYKVSSDAEVSPAFYINIANRNIPSSFFEVEYENVMVFFQNLSKESYAYGTNLFAEYENSYLVSFYQSGQCYMAIFCKQKDRNESVFKGIEEDVFLGGYSIKLNNLEAFVQEDNELILSISPFDILEYAKQELSEKELQGLKKQFKSEDEDQNPMLLCVKLK